MNELFAGARARINKAPDMTGVSRFMTSEMDPTMNRDQFGRTGSRSFRIEAHLPSATRVNARGRDGKATGGIADGC
jgi:hypothetical protein